MTKPYLPDPKPETEIDKDYEKYVRSLPCCICLRKAVFHHESGLGDSGGWALKCTSYYGISLCPYCHEKRGREGFQSFWVWNYKNPWDIVIQNLIEYSQKKDKGFHAKRAIVGMLIEQIKEGKK